MSDPLCPTTFEEFIGQAGTKTRLQLEVIGAVRQKHPLRHVLLYGPPGVGKSSLAVVLAHEMGRHLAASEGEQEYTPLPVHTSIGGQFASAKDTFNTYLKVPEDPRGTIWLIDEADGMTRAVSQSLHPLMTGGYMVDPETSREVVGQPITIMATTNYIASLDRAFKSRFPFKAKLEYYPPDDLAQIAINSARRMGYTLAPEAAQFIGQNAGGEPRRVNDTLLGTAINLVPDHTIGLETIEQTVRLVQLFREGLTKPQVEYLLFVAQSPKLRASKMSIAAGIQEAPEDVVGEHEPYLIHKGYVVVGQGGRQLTEAGGNYLLEMAKGGKGG